MTKTITALVGRGTGDRQQGGADIGLQDITRFASWRRLAQKAGDIFCRGGVR